MSNPRTRPTRCATTLTILAAITSAAWADFALVNAPPGSEAGHLSNGTLMTTRADDWGYGRVLDAQTPFFGETDDQSWTVARLTFNAVTRYAGYSQEFGYDLDGDDLGYAKLLDVHGRGMRVCGEAMLVLDPGESAAWIRGGHRGGRWSSRIADNPHGRDHVVACHVRGVDQNSKRSMLFSEDQPRGGDQDHNDMVVEVAGQAATPGASLMVLLGGGALTFLCRRTV
jgi:hypothetical protein